MFDVTLLLAFVFVVNLPFGYWREGVTKFSPAWFIAVHAAVPLVLVFRSWLEMPFDWAVLPLAVAAYFAGQTAGALSRRSRQGSVAE